MGEFCVCTRCAMPLIRSNEQGISSTKSDERGMQLQQKQRTPSARFYTPIQPDQALKSPIFGRLHVSRSIMWFIVTFRDDKSKLCSILVPPFSPFASLD
jgi:hypothetical protein